MIHYHPDLVQGTEEWLAARCGLLTASEMHLIVTPTLKPASNDNERAHVWELAAQRITRYVEPRYIGDEMLRGQTDEVEARAIYARTYAPVAGMGFITNDDHGFTLGYSPDGLVGEDGLIECKSRRQKFQVETIVTRTMPIEYAIQIQTGLIVSGRAWCDFVSYCGGMPMVVLRQFVDPVMREAILSAAKAFEERIATRMQGYRDALSSDMRWVETERLIEQEMFVS